MTSGGPKNGGPDMHKLFKQLLSGEITQKQYELMRRGHQPKSVKKKKNIKKKETNELLPIPKVNHFFFVILKILNNGSGRNRTTKKSQKSKETLLIWKEGVEKTLSE